MQRMLIAIGFYIIQASDAHEISINKTLHSAAATHLLLMILKPAFRSSHPQMFFKIGVIKNFEIFSGKYLCWSLFL